MIAQILALGAAVIVGTACLAVSIPVASVVGLGVAAGAAGMVGQDIYTSVKNKFDKNKGYIEAKPAVPPAEAPTTAPAEIHGPLPTTAP